MNPIHRFAAALGAALFAALAVCAPASAADRRSEVINRD